MSASIQVEDVADGGEKQSLLPKTSRPPLVCGSLTWLAFARALAFISIVWNILEGAASLYVGFEHMQLSLLAYGGQSGVEIISAVLVWWRLAIPIRTTADELQVIERERKAVRTIGVLFVLLALAVVGAATLEIVHREGPSSTLPGLIVSGTAALAMLVLYVLKLQAAKQLDSNTLHEDAKCSLYCFLLALVVITASVVDLTQDSINTWCHVSFCDFWWIDSVFAILISAVIFVDGVRAFRNSLRADFDGGCGCCSGGSTRVQDMAVKSTAPVAGKAAAAVQFGPGSCGGGDCGNGGSCVVSGGGGGGGCSPAGGSCGGGGRSCE